MLSILHT